MQTTSPAQTPTPVPDAQAPAKRSYRVMLGIAVVVAVVLFAGVYIAWTKRVGTPTEKVYHVGVLNALDYFSPAIDGFKQRMTELGYIEGTNIVYDIQTAPAPVGNEAIIQKFVDATLILSSRSRQKHRSRRKLSLSVPVFQSFRSQSRQKERIS